MDPAAEQKGWLVDFLGGPWDNQSGLFDHEPAEIIHAPLEPPILYRLAIKLGNGQRDRSVQHLIYEAEHGG
jgi:hypothetical protein